MVFAPPVCLMVFLILMGSGVSQANAQEQAQDRGHRILSDFRRSLYVMAERTGGSPGEWDKAEAGLIVRLDELAAQGALNPGVRDEKGRSLLTRAAAHGFGFFVERLLLVPNAADTLELTDDQGLTAYQHAEIALRQTFRACHPVVENPFVLVPLVVMSPYYTDRDPYPRIGALLRAAGADTDLRAARTFWLTTCTNPDPDLRARVEGAQNLQGLLMQAVADIARKDCRRKAEAANMFLLELFGGADIKPERQRELDAVLAAEMAGCDA